MPEYHESMSKTYALANPVIATTHIWFVITLFVLLYLKGPLGA